MLTIVYKDICIGIDEQELADYNYSLDNIATFMDNIVDGVESDVRYDLNNLIGEVGEQIGYEEIIIIDGETGEVEIFDNLDGQFGGYIPGDDDD